MGARLAETLRPGDLVLVSGELGTGKTTLIRGACRALGVDEPVRSPTFTIGHRYAGEVAVSHVDLFRLGSLAGEEPGLLDDYLGAEAVAFVEWPPASAAGLDLPPRPGGRVLRVELAHGGGDLREVAISPPDPAES